MRTVFLVTRHPDVSRLGPALERAGFSAPAVPPDKLATDDVVPRADAMVLDLRDIPPAAFSVISSGYADAAIAILALVPEDQIDRIAVDLPIDDFLMLPTGAAELA